MPGFRDRLRKAMRAGADAQAEREADERHARQHEHKLRGLYDRYEDQLCDHIQSCLKELCGEWPGFRLGPAGMQKGRGYAISRDDRGRSPGGRVDRRYSRLEIAVRPYSRHQFLEVLAKGTVRNKEVFRRGDDDRVETADSGLLKKFIERVVLEFARRYAEGQSTHRR